ncbi:MAG: methionine adenosyltransferase [Clostridia bacterium]|nr:methionine adenosyltransferase [Clostridia bacterium]
MRNYLFTSESVTEGHPDKICDRISDSVLDAMLAQDPMSRVACETAITTGQVLVMGEITSAAQVDIPALVRRAITEIGYTSSEYGFDAATCGILTALDKQSPDIALGVDKSLEAKESNGYDIGAGDQGMMFGYACNETPELMPMPISYAHKLAKRLTDVRKTGVLPYLRPDGKTQVSVRYEDGHPVAIDTIVVSTQHAADVDLSEIRESIIEDVIKPILPEKMIADARILVNPTGRFVIGGPCGDSGLTGRKIIVDTYGGMGRHGGGAFSGKDATKVDRSSAYAARRVAKTIVKAGLAERCEVQLAYAIGVAQPVSVLVDTFGTGTVDEERLTKAVKSCFDLRPAAIIEELKLRSPIFTPLSSYGHMGREDLGVMWEDTSKAQELLEYLK